MQIPDVNRAYDHVLVTYGDVQGFATYRETDGVWTFLLTPKLPKNILSIRGDASSEESRVVDVQMSYVTWGLAYTQENGIAVPLDDVRVYDVERDVYIGSSHDGGLLGIYLKEGVYHLRFEKDGYRTREAWYTVNNDGIFADDVLLERELQEVPVQIDRQNPSEKIETQPAPDSSSGIFEDAQQVFVVGGSVTALAASGASLAVVGWSNIFAFLRMLFTQPALLLAKKRKQPLGVAFHSMKKMPLDLVTIRAFHAQEKRLLKTAVTNAKGEFFLNIAPEIPITLQAIRRGFLFPSTYLKDVRNDGNFSDIYTQGIIGEGGEYASRSVAVALDPEEFLETPKKIRQKNILQSLAKLLAPSSVILSGMVAVVDPGILSGSLFAVQSLIYGALLSYTKTSGVPKYGIVRDSVTGAPVGNAVIRLFEPKYNKLIDTTLADARGRYIFSLGASKYILSCSAPGYETSTLNDVEVGGEGMVLFGKDLSLRKQKTA